MRRLLHGTRRMGFSAKLALLGAGLGVLAWSTTLIAAGVTTEEIQTSTTAPIAGDAVKVHVVEDTGDRIVIDYEIGDFTKTPVEIGQDTYAQIGLGEEGLMKEVVGAPELPHVCRSIVIPNDAEMEARVLASDYYEIGDVRVPPSKGFISRKVNPNDVPYTFGEVYDVNTFYPQEVVTLREPYILRDYRGVVVKLHPFQYNPVTQTLRVYTSVTVEVFKTRAGEVNVKNRPFRPDDVSLAFHKIYKSHFLNYGAETRYTPLGETGDLLIIYYDSWASNIQPLVNHKNSIGITTTAVAVGTIGNNATSIKNYIQNAYDTGDLAFVLLVGDAAQVATPSASGGASDPTYSKVSGGDDYPDIMVGRFSAQSAAEVDTQVLRTIEYETMPATQQTWFKRGTGIASNQGPGHNGEYDNEHMDYIRDDLLAYGYTSVDQIYDPTGTDTQVTNALNAGRGIVNYCGHGSATSWGSTGFNNADVNNLANDNTLPFIFSVACNNGEFDNYTDCFAEAWLQATNGSEPTGAVAMYASSISQSWNPPMDAQDEFVDRLVDEDYFSFGALCFAGSCKMIDINGSGGVSMFNTWHVFGDPSVRVVGGGEPTCNDGIQNQGEDKIDCGGPCPPCDCLVNGDCDDALYCNGAETCDAYGECQTGSDPCPGQLCDEGSDTCYDCQYDSDCDDGLYCNGAETCVGGFCQAGTDPCPGQNCDEVNDQCVPLPIKYTPAEYDFNEGMLIRWGSYNDILTDMTVGVTTGDPDAIVYVVVTGASQQSSATSTLTSAGADMSQVEFITYTTDTGWIRDYGPRFISNDNVREFVDFEYNRPRPNDNAFPGFLASLWSEPISEMPLTHGGGNLHVVGEDAFMSELVLDENSGLSAQDVADIIEQYFNLDLTIYDRLPSSFDATGHIDMWMLPASDAAVIVGEYSSSTGEPYTITENAVSDLTSKGYTVYRTPGWNSGGVHYTYTNAVIMNDVVLLPTYNVGEDATALSVFQTAFPGRTIVEVDCTSIISAAGAVHCIMDHVPGVMGTECTIDEDCADGLFCNGAETCVGGYCQAGSDPCPGQMCDEANDVCVDCLSDGDCDDGLYCNGAETCVSGSCQAGTAVDCNDGVACTDDSCNEGTDSCDNVPNDANCDNGLYCDGAETCHVTLGCQAGTAVDCNDGVACTADSCNEGTDQCDNIPDDGYCDDGLFCNGAEVCDTGLGCIAGGDPCPGQMCDEANDICVDCFIDADCDDGLFCNGAETCVSGTCQAGTDPCLPGQFCNEATDTCEDVECLIDEDCDDGSDCTVDTCVDGVCHNDCPATVSSYPYAEGFESGWGDWVNLSGDDMDWTRNSGSTPSSSTGPSSAHGGSYYVYTESSSPNYPSKTAILEGPCFDLADTVDAELTFWYHMYGTAMGTLNVEVSEDCVSWTNVWSLSGNQGNAWYEANVDLTSYCGSTIVIRFRGVTGSSYTSDMAVDDLALTVTPSISCDYDWECADGLFCNGAEVCVDHLCQPGSDPCPGESCDEVNDQCVPGPSVQYSWNMDTNPGWTTEGLWAWGQPTGGGGTSHGNPDPTSGYTGSNVYGYNLNGDYENYLSETHLTSSAIDCAGLTEVSLKLYRWLNVEQPAYDHAYLRVSNNGSSWTTLWENTAEVTDSSWNLQEFDISTIADNQATVYLRWTMGSTDSSWQYSGWNIDDVEIWAVGGAEPTCDDGILNQGEDKIDCGGPCPPCNCLADGDCDDGLFCNGAETCDDYGECQAGGDPCPGQLCDEVGDVCVDCLDDGDCDDGLYCNGAETCVGGACQPGTDPCPGQGCDEVNDECIPGPTAQLESGTVTVGGSFVTIGLTNTYDSPVVVCSAQYNNNTTPVVSRITNVTSTSFDLRLQNPSGGAVASDKVSCVVVEEGAWTIDGVKIEAQTYLSTVTDENNSWVGEAQSYGQSYTNPVVIGQVMSANDPLWSVFWCQGSSRTSPPSATALKTGKTVCEDTVTARADETIGFIVFEAGHGTIGGVAFEALVGADTVQGVTNSPPYSYTFNTAFASAPTVAVVAQAGMDGGNGGWAYTYGSTMATSTSLYLAIDEDQIGDTERNHTTEQVGYVVFESSTVYP